MHKVRSSFRTKKGQFRDDISDEAVGIDVNAMGGNGEFQFTIGHGSTVYYADKALMRQVAGNKRGFIIWRSRRSKPTAIFPLYFFSIKEQPPEEAEVVERNPQQALFSEKSTA